MIPVKECVIVDFLSWVKENHPEIKSLRNIPDEDLKKLCDEFLEWGYIDFVFVDKILRDFRRWLSQDGRSKYRSMYRDFLRDRVHIYSFIHFLFRMFHEFLHEYEDKLWREYGQYIFDREFEEEISVERLYRSVKDFLNGYMYANLAKQQIDRKSPSFDVLFDLLPISDELEISCFIDWLSHNHPEIDLLANIPDDVLKGLVDEFLRSRGKCKRFATVDHKLILSQLIKLKKGEYYKEHFEKLLERSVRIKKRNRNYIETIDPLNRYRTVPLHAIFLYSSQHDYIHDYIIKNWGALSSMSGDYCDIYFSIGQLDYETDAFDVIDQIKAFEEINIEKLPGIIFWEKNISNNYFLSFDNLDEKNITKLLFTVFQQIRKSPNLESIKKGESIFKEEHESKKAKSEICQPTVTINIEQAFGEVIGLIQGDFIKRDMDIRTLKAIFKTLECDKKNTERIKRLERTLRYNEKAIEKVYSLIEELIKKNVSNKSFISKLKDFAYNVATNVPGSIIATAIFVALMGFNDEI